MQRLFTPIGKRYLAGALALAGTALIGMSVRAVHVHAAISNLPGRTTVPMKLDVPSAMKAVEELKVGPAETGKASWYGEEFQGRTTASGEQFDRNTLTCAHRTLPLGSLLRVTNLRNHRTVTVRVNDRGPMLEDRILDLSEAAARKIGLGGLSRVRVERVKKVTLPPAQATATVQPAPPVLVARNSYFLPFPFFRR